MAVEAGMMLAALVVHPAGDVNHLDCPVTPDYVVAGRRHSLQLRELPYDVAIYRVHGPFLFGSTDKLDDIERATGSLPRVVILRLRNMTAIDVTGLHAIEHLADALRQSGRSLLLCGMRDQPARMMERAAFHEHIGAANLLPSVESALSRARALLA